MALQPVRFTGASRYRQLERDLEDVRRALEELEGPDLEDSLSAYRTWAPEVGRYSFQWRA